MSGTPPPRCRSRTSRPPARRAGRARDGAPVRSTPRRREARADAHSRRRDRRLDVVARRHRRSPTASRGVLAIERAQEAVLARGRHQLAVAPPTSRAPQRPRLREIPVVRVVGNELPVPAQLPGPQVERDDGVGVEVLAGPQLRRQIGRRVGDRDVDLAVRARSSESAVQTAPPPTGISFGLGQVSAPGSPGFGTVLKRHTGEPSSTLNAPTQP